MCYGSSIPIRFCWLEINPGNVSRFKELTQFLAEDLKKLKSVNQ